jgi:hypothetical protein
VELRARGFYYRKRTVTPLRLLIVLALLGVGIWKLGPHVWGKKKSAAAPVAAQPVAVPPPPQAPPKPAEPPAISASQEAAEVKADIAALSQKFTENIAAFEKLKTEIAAAGSALRDYPYKVQLVGTDIDHVPVRSIAARQFQTRFVRILYDASRELAEVARGRTGADTHRAAFEKTSETLKQFEADWTAFAKKY